MILAVDVMGFENKISEAVNACFDFAKKNKDVNLIIVGDKNKIDQICQNKQLPNIVFEHAEDVILMTDSVLSCRNKKNSSMYKAIELVKNDKAHGVLSAGSTISYVALTSILLQKMDGVPKYGFMPFVPTRMNFGLNFIDVGANKDCEPEDLLGFAKMANIYVKNVRKINKPKIALLNIGSEENKGHELQINTYKMLKENSALNFIGNIEPRDLLEGITDIVVSDGYSGNLVLKAVEGSGKTIFLSLKEQYKKPWNWLGLIFSLKMIFTIKKKFDYKNNAGAFVIGLNKIAVKTHGSADYKQFYSSLRMLKEVIDNNVIDKIREEFKNGQN